MYSNQSGVQDIVVKLRDFFFEIKRVSGITCLEFSVIPCVYVHEYCIISSVYFMSLQCCVNLKFLHIFLQLTGFFFKGRNAFLEWIANKTSSEFALPANLRSTIFLVHM
jgi:hypothetical protein